MKENYTYTSFLTVTISIFISMTAVVFGMTETEWGSVTAAILIIAVVCSSVLQYTGIPAFFKAGKRSVRFGIFGIVTTRIYYEKIREIKIGHEFKNDRFEGYYQEIIRFICDDDVKYTFYSRMDNADVYAADPKKLEREFSEGRFERLKKYILEMKQTD